MKKNYSIPLMLVALLGGASIPLAMGTARAAPQKPISIDTSPDKCQPTGRFAIGDGNRPEFEVVCISADGEFSRGPEILGNARPDGVWQIPFPKAVLAVLKNEGKRRAILFYKDGKGELIQVRIQRTKGKYPFSFADLVGKAFQPMTLDH